MNEEHFQERDASVPILKVEDAYGYVKLVALQTGGWMYIVAVRDLLRSDLLRRAAVPRDGSGGPDLTAIRAAAAVAATKAGRDGSEAARWAGDMHEKLCSELERGVRAGVFQRNTFA